MGRILPGDSRAIVEIVKYMNEHFGGEKEVARRNMLKVYAETLANQARANTSTDCKGFSLVVSFAASQFPDANDLGVQAMVEDLKSVLIGDGLENAQRNRGKYALRFQAFHDTGFKDKFCDGGNQVQHAMAGIYISYMYGWAGEISAMAIEDSQADKELYRATFKLGSALNAENYKLLSSQILSELEV